MPVFYGVTMPYKQIKSSRADMGASRSRILMPKKSHDDDVAFIKALAELLNENELTELQVKREYGEDDSLNVRVSRRMEAPAQYVTQAPMHTPAPAAADTVAAEAPTAALGEDPVSHPGAVTSPM